MSGDRCEGPLQAFDVAAIETEPRIVPVIPEKPAYGVRATGCINITNILQFDAAIHRDWFRRLDERSGRDVSKQTVVVVSAEFLIWVNARETGTAAIGNRSGESKLWCARASQGSQQRQ